MCCSGYAEKAFVEGFTKLDLLLSTSVSDRTLESEQVLLGMLGDVLTWSVNLFFILLLKEPTLD